MSSPAGIDHEDHLRATARRSVGIVTALVPHIGYPAASVLARDALAEGRDVAELATARRLLPAEQVTAILGDLELLVHGPRLRP